MELHELGCCGSVIAMDLEVGCDEQGLDRHQKVDGWVDKILRINRLGSKNSRQVLFLTGRKDRHEDKCFL